MLNMIKADFYRILKGKLGIISVIILFSFSILLGAMGKEYPVKEIIESNLSSGAIFMPIIITNVLLISWGHEFNYRTVNNAIVSGVSRWKFFLNKWLLTVLLTTLCLLVYAGSLCLATLVFKGQIEMGYTLKILLVQYPMYLAVCGLGVLLFNLVTAIYASITIYIVMSFIGDNIISMIIGTYLPKLDFLLDYLFISNISNVVNLDGLSANLMMTYMASALLLSLIFISLSYQLFKQKELK